MNRSFYAVRKGRQPGIYSTWEEIKPLVDNVPGASFKKFSSIEEAERFIKETSKTSKTRALQVKITPYIKKKSPINLCDNQGDNHIDNKANINNDFLFDSFQTNLSVHDNLSNFMTTSKPQINVPDKTPPTLSYQPPSYQSSSYQPPSYQPPSYQSSSYQPSSYQTPSIIPLVVATPLSTGKMNMKKFLKIMAPSTINSENQNDKKENHQNNQEIVPIQKPEIVPIQKPEIQKISKLMSETKIVNVYCDGSTFNNGKKNASGGIGVYFGVNDKRNISEPFTRDIPTNQKTELYAMTKTLQILELMIKNDPSSCYQFHIYSDNEYTINCITKWVPGWIKTNWKTKKSLPVKNVELIKTLYGLYCKHRNQYHIHHVFGHTGKKDIHSIGNDHADLLAKGGSYQHPNFRQN